MENPRNWFGNTLVASNVELTDFSSFVSMYLLIIMTRKEITSVTLKALY